MTKYYIDYNTGAGNICKDFTSLSEAMKCAEEHITYTQKDVDIYEREALVAQLPWESESSYTAELDIVHIDFGESGYYSPWVTMEGEANDK